MIPFLQILATVVAIGLMVVAISKNYLSSATLFCIGLVILSLYTAITGLSVMGDNTTGSNFIDIFELIKTKFVSTLSSNGLIIMAVMGFVAYMNHIKASTMLAYLASKPLSKIKNKYFICVMAIIIAAVLKLFVPSHSSLTALLISTMFPVLVASGVKKKTAACTVILGGAYDLGPSCPITTWVMSQEGFAEHSSVAAFFAQYQIPVTLLVMAVTIVLFLMVNIKADKTENEEAETVELNDPNTLGVPKFYAVLPMIPLVLVMVFSDLVGSPVKISVVAANLIGFFFAFLVRIISYKGSKKDAFNAASAFFDGLANTLKANGSVGLAISASVFTTGLTLIGGTTVIMNSLTTSNLGGIMIVIAACALYAVTTIASGSSVGTIYACAPLLPPAAAATGANVLAMAVPLISTGGLARCISPVSAAVIIASGSSGVNVQTIVKRSLIPALGGMLTALIASSVLL